MYILERTLNCRLVYMKMNFVYVFVPALLLAASDGHVAVFILSTVKVYVAIFHFGNFRLSVEYL
jgi:hypothetical protein